MPLGFSWSGNTNGDGGSAPSQALGGNFYGGTVNFASPMSVGGDATGAPLSSGTMTPGQASYKQYLIPAALGLIGLVIVLRMRH